MARVTILSGPIRSGKTTWLLAWARGRTDVAGLLSPDGPGGRIFVDLSTGETEAMERPQESEAVLTVGRFRFRAAAFDWGNARLVAAAEQTIRSTIVVDEVGPLELAGSGLRVGVEAALARSRGRVVLVVRRPLVDTVRRTFGISHAEMVAGIGW